jgi:hypothetical protein
VFSDNTDDDEDVKLEFDVAVALNMLPAHWMYQPDHAFVFNNDNISPFVGPLAVNAVGFTHASKVSGAAVTAAVDASRAWLVPSKEPAPSI